MTRVSALAERLAERLRIPTLTGNSRAMQTLTERIAQIAPTRAAIEATMRTVAYDKQKAAKMLGIGLRTLYRKLKEYGL